MIVEKHFFQTLCSLHHGKARHERCKYHCVQFLFFCPPNYPFQVLLDLHRWAIRSICFFDKYVWWYVTQQSDSDYSDWSHFSCFERFPSSLLLMAKEIWVSFLTWPSNYNLFPFYSYSRLSDHRLCLPIFCNCRILTRFQSFLIVGNL